MGIYHCITSQTSWVNSCHSATAVGVICHPSVAPKVALQDEDMMPADSDHPRCRVRAWEAEPIGSKVEAPDSPPEDPDARPAPAELPPRAAAGVAYNRSCVPASVSWHIALLCGPEAHIEKPLCLFGIRDALTGHRDVAARIDGVGSDWMMFASFCGRSDKCEAD
jgi:hypothetical protein